jgi:hypothetical protein
MAFLKGNCSAQRKRKPLIDGWSGVAQVDQNRKRKKLVENCFLLKSYYPIP